jgi:putative methylcobalamin:homocysteine methyltransferase
LSEKVKVDQELKFASNLLKPVLAKIREHEGIISSMHVCRGNWTTDESVLLSGAYSKLSKFFSGLKVDMLALEFSTPRAGEVEELFHNNLLAKKIILGYGVINPRTPNVETVDEIVKKVEKVLEFLPPDRIWLNSDCGFATFSNRPLNSYMVIEAKLRNMVKAAEVLRGRV